MTISILKEFEKKLPSDAQITEVNFEGSEIVIYTKNRQFFTESEDIIRAIVKELKKRVEVRPDLSITMEAEKAKKTIEKLVPEGAGIQAIYFEPELGKVIIESQKPGLIIGKGGETFKKIMGRDGRWTDQLSMKVDQRALLKNNYSGKKLIIASQKPNKSAGLIIVLKAH